MLNYETILILDSTLNEEGVAELVGKYVGQIEKLEATIKEVESWGRRPLAQNTNGQRYGIYVCIKFETENTQIVKLMNQQYGLDAQVMVAETHKVGMPKKQFKLNKRLQVQSDDAMMA